MPHPETPLKLRERLTLSRLRIDAQIGLKRPSPRHRWYTKQLSG
jgi:hypothetical protein